jgi:hypothetical protein
MPKNEIIIIGEHITRKEYFESYELALALADMIEPGYPHDRYTGRTA